MDFDLQFTSPYEFLETFEDSEASEVTVVFNRRHVELLIDFAITIHESFFFTAEDIFYACFLVSVCLRHEPSRVQAVRQAMSYRFEAESLFQRII